MTEVVFNVCTIEKSLSAMSDSAQNSQLVDRHCVKFDSSSACVFSMCCPCGSNSSDFLSNAMSGSSPNRQLAFKGTVEFFSG